MQLYSSHPAPFSVSQQDNLLVFENEYLQITHDLKQGGQMSQAIVKNGAGTSVIAKPQLHMVGILVEERNQYYTTEKVTADWELSTRHGNPLLTLSFPLVNSQGDVLPGLKVKEILEFSPWGEIFHTIDFHAEAQINHLGVLQIGTLFPDKRINLLGYAESHALCPNYYGGNAIRWMSFYGGERWTDAHGYSRRKLPVLMMALEQGEDGIQYNLGDNLEQWDHTIGGDYPGYQKGNFCYSVSDGCYVMGMNVLVSNMEGHFLKKGANLFDFSIGFPFIKKNIVPLQKVGAKIMDGGLENPWMDEAYFTKMQAAGATLMRLHNDGDQRDDGNFWRDAAYPPYSPEKMKEMDACIARAHKHNISVTPYFSLHEFHPEAQDFKENAEQWQRLVTPELGPIDTKAAHGIYGRQMCLCSGWDEKRKATIDQVLTNHDFDGVYYDWVCPLECNHPGHGGRHWDNQKVMDIITWSRERVGEKGEVYLHMTNAPNFYMENVATQVLTEEVSYAKIGVDMFSPHVHFMNIAPRQICEMISAKTSDADKERFAMAALLNHASISTEADYYVNFCLKYGELMDKTVYYEKHTAPGEGRISTDNAQVAASAYWKRNGEAMILLANFSEEQQTASYRFTPKNLPIREGKATIPPLSILSITLD